MAWASFLQKQDDTLRNALTEWGYDDHEVLACSFEATDEDEVFEQEVKVMRPDGALEAADLKAAWERASSLRRVTAGQIASATDADIVVWAEKKRRRITHEPDALLLAESRRAPASGKAPCSRWPTRLKQRLAAAATPAARDLAEAEEWQRWAKRCEQIARKAQLPLVLRPEVATREDLVARALCRGVRAATLRKRVRDMEQFARYLEAACDRSWPSNPGDVIDYMTARAAEPCGKSVLASMQGALFFFEKGGGVAESVRLSRDPLVLNLLESFQKDLAKGLPPSVAAPREPIALTAAREAYITDTAQPEYKRAYAWWKSVQSWASLRFGDNAGLSPSSLRLVDGTLRGQLLRTKTTGADKKRGERAFAISDECYLLHPEWLGVGFYLWEGFLTDREYFLVAPSEDCQAASHSPLGYSDASAMSRALNAELAALKDGGAEPLILPALAPFWTEHSARHNVPSWVASTLNVAEDWVSLLGGWFHKGTVHRYIATAERRILLMQAAVARKLRGGRDGRDIVDESKLRDEIAAYLTAKGVGAEVIAEQLERLRWFRGPSVVGRSDPLSSLVGTGPLLLDEELEDGFGAETVRPDMIMEDAPGACAHLPAEFVGQYAVSISGKSKHRCLHLLGGCHRSPGLHYEDFELFDSRPEDSLYHKVCGQCWKTEPKGDAGDESGTESDSSSASG